MNITYEVEMDGVIEGRGRTRIDRATALVAAYVSSHHVAPSDLPALIALVSAALDRLNGVQPEVTREPIQRLSPAQIRNSIRPDALISFIDGKPYKALKRHLRYHGIDPQTYRQRYGLPVDYPMVSVAYSEKRSAISKALSAAKSVRDRAARPASPFSAKATRH